MNYFQHRNPVTIGFVVFAVMALFLALALNAKNLPLIGDGTEYKAQFTEVGGLRGGDAVKLAGVNIGTVKSIELKEGEVEVTFTVDNHVDNLEARTGASVKVQTLLGRMYLALQPAGGGQLKAGATIPASRTNPPFDIVDTVTGLTETVEEINPDQIGEAVDVLNQVTERAPESFRGAVQGIGKLSKVLADRDDDLRLLIKNADELSGTVSDRNTEIAKILQDSGPLIRY